MNAASPANPYSSPEGELISDNDLEYGVVRFLSPSCRINRVRYLAHSFLVGILFTVIIGVVVALAMAGGNDGQAMGAVWMGILGLIYIAYIACFWIIVIQRCHDLNKSGFFSLLMLVPLVNMFIGFYFLFAPGTRGENSFGKRPPPNSTWHVIVALLLPAIAIIGIIAAVSLPAYQSYVERANQAATQQK